MKLIISKQFLILLISLLLLWTACQPIGVDNDAPPDEEVPADEKPEEPENPEEPEQPENPENPENPDNPENPENPDNPDTPENPENPDPNVFNVPDEAFKAYLLENFDSDKDGELSEEERLEIRNIEVSTLEIHSLEGITWFKNLETLSAAGQRDAERNILGQLEKLDVSGLDKLQTIYCKHNHIKALILDGNASLTSLITYGNSLTELDLSGAPALESVDAGDCAITSIDLSGSAALKTLYVHNNVLAELNLTTCPALTTLRADRNNIRYIYINEGQTFSSVQVDDNVQFVRLGYPSLKVKTGLRSILIQTPTEITSKEEWTDYCTLKIVDDNGNVDFQAVDVAVRGRGNVTWGFEKKPYTFKLQKKTDLLGHGKSKRYLLLANWMDRTLLRNDVAFEAARRTSLSWTPSGEFVELYLNGEHLGNYWFGENIKVESSRLNADVLLEADTYYDAEYRFYSTYGYKPNTSSYGLPYGVKYPDDDEMTSSVFTSIQSKVAETEAAIYDGASGYAGAIDSQSFADWYLVHELCWNAEPNHPKSCYFHYKNGIMYAGPVWDFDWYTFQYESGLGISESIYFKELLKKPAFVALLKQRWVALKPSFETLDDYIDTKAEEIRASEAINRSMWPNNSYNVNLDCTMSFDSAIARMKATIEYRISSLDTAINSL